MKFPSFVTTPMAWGCCVAGLAGWACLPVSGQGNGDRTAIAIEALSRLKGIDLESSPAVKAAVRKVLASTKGTAQFVELVRDFRIKDQNQSLLEIALSHPDNSTAVEAARLVLENDGVGLFEQAQASTNTNSALKSIEVLGHLGEKRVAPLLEAVVIDARRDSSLRKRAVRSLTQTQEGAAALLRLAQEKRLRLPDLAR